MRARVVLIAAAALGGCATGAPEVSVLSSTPASIEFSAWCPHYDDPQCRQMVADKAQTHCQAAKQNAQFVRSALIERGSMKGERGHFVFNCVR